MPDKKRTAALNWENLRYAVALSRHGSLSATARILKVNHATVARRLAALEGSLGQTLFDRRADGYVPTAAGHSLLRIADQMEEAALAIQDQLEPAPALAGSVRVTSICSLIDLFLVSRLGEFARRYPEIELEFLAESRNVSLARREADLALRLGRPKEGEFMARRVAVMGFGLYASAAYRQQRRKRGDDVFITFDDDGATLPEAVHLRRVAAGRRIAFRSNSQTAQAAAARAGLGIALLPYYMATHEPDLVPVGPQGDSLQREIWLLIRRDLARIPRIRAVADYLIALLAEERATLLGRP